MKAALLIFLLTCSLFVLGQNKIQPDSLKFYKDIEEVAKKQKSTHWLFKEIFNLPEPNKTKEVERKQLIYDSLEGKIIRNIDVVTFDPFGYDINDTCRMPSSFIEKSLNFLHAKTTRKTIINQLLYQKGDSLDPLIVKESERLLRRASPIREIITLITPVEGTDSVDVLIREHDYWSITFGLAYSSDKYLFRFNDRNFLGLAHNFRSDFYYLPDQRKYVVSGLYSVPYNDRYLVIPTAYYSTDPDNFLRGLSIARPFLTPLFKWAGSAQFYDVKTTGLANDPSGELFNYSTRYFIRDFWLAHSMSLSKDTSQEMRLTKLIVGARYNITTYNYYAPEWLSPGFLYENTNMVFLNVGISHRSFYRDYYVYRFGVQEDVPSGRILNLITGYEKRGSGDRWYTALEAGTGNHFDNFGYFSLSASYGTFIYRGELQQGALNLSAGYFSDLFKFNRTRLRQFARLSANFGFNRIRNEGLLLSEDIRGFQNNSLTGLKKLSFGLQSQAYLPYSFLGFHFAPFLFADFGLIADEGESFFKSRFYQGYGLGLLIRNELLVINNFQVTLGFYPFIPDKSQAVTRFVPVKSEDFSFPDFQIGAPSIVQLQ